MTVGEKLEKFVLDYESLRKEYSQFLSSGGARDKHVLSSFQSKFNNLKGDLVQVYPYILKEQVRRDNKAMTAVKARLARAIHEGRYKDFEATNSWNKCESLAASTDEYRDMLEQRAFWYESLETLTEIKFSIQSYISEIEIKISL